MILCIDTHKLDTAPYIQKDVDLAGILLNCTKYYNSVEEAEKNFYVPLDFSVSVRTVYTNKVLQIKDGDNCSYYVNHTNVGQFAHKGYDLMMYLSAIGFVSCVNYSDAFDTMMLKYSTLQPIGLYNPDPGFLNPIVYTHIIISDEAEGIIKPFLKPGVSLIHITEMEERVKNSGGLYLTALLDTLIIVHDKKEEVLTRRYK